MDERELIAAATAYREARDAWVEMQRERERAEQELTVIDTQIQAVQETMHTLRRRLMEAATGEAQKEWT